MRTTPAPGLEACGSGYEDAAHKHAVTHLGGVQKYWYDANGNATKRINASQTITMTYDVENRLIAMTGGVRSSYVYDGAGNRVKETSGVTTTVYIGAYFEWTGSTATMKSYYYAGGTRVATPALAAAPQRRCKCAHGDAGHRDGQLPAGRSPFDCAQGRLWAPPR
jgi:YD repeat-containing protein